MQSQTKLLTLPLVSLHTRASAVVRHRRKIFAFARRLDSAQLILSGNCKRSAICAAVAGSSVRGTHSEAQMSKSDDVLRLFKGLSISDDDQMHVTNLAKLEQQLQIWLGTEGTSMTSFKKLLREHAICLGNFTAYHSQKALKQALRTDPALIVSKKKAKKYQLVKQCLTRL